MVYKITRKEIVREAVKWDGKNFAEVSQFVKETYRNKRSFEDAERTAMDTGIFSFGMILGMKKVSSGNWIIKRSDGDFYVASQEDIDRKYNLVMSTDKKI